MFSWNLDLQNQYISTIASFFVFFCQHFLLQWCWSRKKTLFCSGLLLSHPKTKEFLLMKEQSISHFYWHRQRQDRQLCSSRPIKSYSRQHIHRHAQLTRLDKLRLTWPSHSLASHNKLVSVITDAKFKEAGPQHHFLGLYNLLNRKCPMCLFYF